MAKELTYRVKIIPDEKANRQFSQSVSRGQEQAQKATQDTITEINREIAQLELMAQTGRESAGQISEAIERLNKDLATAPKQTQKVIRAQKRLHRLQDRLADSTQNVTNRTGVMRNTISGANQTLFSFGDIINDSAQFQFGFAQGSRAIGNNIAFMAEQFSNVQNRAGSFTGALKAMGSSLLGPGGVILGINLAVTAITLFGDKLFGAGEQAKKTRDEIDRVNDSIKEFASEAAALGPDPVFDPLGAITQERELEQLRNVKSELEGLFDLREERESLKQTIGFTEQANRRLRNTFEELDEGTKRYDRYEKLLEKSNQRISDQESELDELNNQIKVQEELFGDLSKAQEEKIQQTIEDAEGQAALNEAYLKLNPTLRLQKELSEESSAVLRDLEIGIGGASSAAQNLVSDYRDQIRAIKQQNNLTREQKDQLFLLTNVVERLNDALGKNNEELEKSSTTIEDRVTRAIESYEIGIEGSRKKLEGLNATLIVQISQLRNQGDLTDKQIDRLITLRRMLDEVNTALHTRNRLSDPSNLPELDPAIDGSPTGTIAEIERNIQAFEKMQRQLDLTTEEGRKGFNILTKKIKEAKDELNEIQGNTDNIESSFDRVEKAIARAGAQAIITANNIEEAANRIIDTIIAEIVAYAIESAIRDLPFPENIAAAAGAAVAGRGLAELIPDFGGSGGGGSGGGASGVERSARTSGGSGALLRRSTSQSRQPTTQQQTQTFSPQQERLSRQPQNVQSQDKQPVEINVTTKSDAFGLAWEVRNGEAQIRSKQEQ